MEIYKGNIVYSKSNKEIVELSHYFIGVDNGAIIFISDSLPKEYLNH